MTDFKRYERNIALEDIKKEGQEKILSAKVLVTGCGGLGSVVLENLAALGVGKIGLCDGDRVEISNLNRQIIHLEEFIGEKKVISAKNWLHKFNSGIKIETFDKNLTMENYNEITENFDILVDCTDSFKSKFLLNDISLKTLKPLVHGGVCGYKGQVTTILPKKSACLRCLFPKENLDVEIQKGVVAPSVGLVGVIQAYEVLKLILNKETLEGKILFIDGLNLNFKTVKIERNKNCICAL